jgi:hypothetical protein
METDVAERKRAMTRSAVIAIALFLSSLSDVHGTECDTRIEVTENRRVVLPERVHSTAYGRRGLWLQNTGDKDVLCAVGAKMKHRLLPGEVWEEKGAGSNLRDELEFEEVSCVTSQGTAILKGCDY